MTTTLLPPARRWWTLAVVSVTTFMLMLDLSIVAIALPSIHSSLHADFGGMQWVFDAYALTLAAFLVTAGSIADRIGRKRIFLGGLLIFTAASLACGLAGSIDVLNVSRAVQGVGAAVMFAVGPALLGHDFRGKERAIAFGAFGAAIGVGSAIGPLIGGALTSGPGWRWIFFLNVPVGVVIFLPALLRLRESRLANAHRPDLIGMVTFTLFLGALALAIIRGNTAGWFSDSNITLYAVSAVALCVFLGAARARGQHAMFDPTIFRSRTFIGLCAVTFLLNAAGFPSIFLETTYFQRVLHGSAWQGGLWFLPLTVTLFVFGALGGALMRKISFRAIVTTAMLAMGAGLLLTLLSSADGSWTALIPSMIAVGAAIGLFQPARAALAIGVVEPARAGVASGINETFQQMGMALGIAIAGAFFENRVVNSFLHSSVAAKLGPQSHAIASGISTGNVQPPAHSAGSAFSAQVVTAGRVAFTAGFHDAMILCCVGAFLAAAIAIVTLRDKDLHESARAGIPPELPQDSGVDGEDTGVDGLEPVPAPAATRHSLQ
jgi:EmrB/QacA subfamily drug resistance transporter